MSPHNPVIKSGFVDIEKLRSADGIVAIISQRRGNGVLTFAVFKEFERDGAYERTSFIPGSLGESYETMVKLVRARLGEIEGFIADARHRTGSPPSFDELTAFLQPAAR